MKFVLRKKLTKELNNDSNNYFLGSNGKVYHKDDLEKPNNEFDVCAEVPLLYSNVPTIFNGDFITYKDDDDNYYREEVKDNCLFDYIEDAYVLLDYALDEIQILDIDRNEFGESKNGKVFEYRIWITEYPVEGSYNVHDLYDCAIDLLEDGFINGSSDMMSPFELINELTYSNIRMKVKLKLENKRVLSIDVDQYVAKWLLECGHEIRI